VKSCPRCAADAPDTALKCAQCGSLIVAPPPTAGTPLGSEPAPAESSAPAAPSIEEQFFTPVAVRTLAPPQSEPVIRSAAPERGSRTLLYVAVAVVLVVGVAGAIHLFAGGSSKTKTPVILAPHDPSAGLPSSLDDVVRQQAESARQVAFSAVSQVWSQNSGPLDGHQLEQANPALQWLDATVSSTGPHEVSFAEAQNTVTIAISASNKDICAFGRLPLGGVAEYVTMGNMSSCRAVDAPTTGWSTQRGGSASDLPPEGY
jgi:hypothetical protein